MPLKLRARQAPGTRACAVAMDALLCLLVLSVCVGVHSEELMAALARRSGIHVYASDYAHDQPMSFVAIPLHKPIPLVRVISRAPGVVSKKRRSPTLVQPKYNQHYYNVDKPEYTSQKGYGYEAPVYASSMTQSWYMKPENFPYNKIQVAPISSVSPFGRPMVLLADPSVHEENLIKQANNEDPLILSPNAEEPIIFYARPNPQGGYTYRKKPEKTVNRNKEPIILRIHKYRIVRDDR